VRCLANGFVLLLLVVLAACSTRASHPSGADPPADLAENSVRRLISVWHEQMRQYIEREGGGDPAVLSHTTTLHSRDVLRPGHITFGVLDLDTDLPGRNGWDVQGVLIGKCTAGAHAWYIFMVGIVRRDDYRPWELQDIRMVAFAPLGPKASWEISTADPGAVQRYRDTFPGPGSVRFPSDADRFSMTVSEDRISVHEVQSGADWTLELHDDPFGPRGQVAIPVQRWSSGNRPEGRFEIARQMLEGSAIGVSEVAAALDYADASAFTRAFRRWSGTTPAQWRAESKAGRRHPRVGVAPSADAWRASGSCHVRGHRAVKAVGWAKRGSQRHRCSPPAAS